MDLGTTNIFALLVILVTSITLHEAMHAFAGFWLGDDTAEREGRISLNPIKHIDPYGTIVLPLITLLIFRFPLLAAKPVPFDPRRVRYGEFGAALVGLAGPLTNFGLAVLAALFLHNAGNGISGGVFDFVYTALQVNIMLFVFNMVPVPPLDGSRLLYAFAPEGLQSLMAQLEQYGILIVFGLVLFVPTFSVILTNLNQALLNFLV